MLRFAILELLSHKPLSGYELKKRFNGSIVFFWRASHSQIYPELRNMEAEGLIVGSRISHESRPTKKVYAITAKGRDALVRWVAEPAGLQSVKDEMMLKCFAFNLISPAEAERQITHHQRLHEQRLATYRRLEQQLVQKYGELRETTDPILFWHALTLEHAISFERMYIEWCGTARAAQQRFARRSTAEDGARRGGEQSPPASPP
jgi:DNA-binding PadR family transcriptional regulator